MSARISVPSYIGQVANRSFVATESDTQGLTWASRTFHIAATDIISLAVADGGWRVAANGNSAGEIACLGTTTLRRSVEYPAGSGKIYPLTYGLSQSLTGSMATGTTLWTNERAVRIPRGQKFYLHRQWVNASEVVFNSNGNGPTMNVSAGDAIQQTATDTTTSGTITDGGFSLAMYPVAVVGRTRDASIAYFGDSRSSGLTDTTIDATGCTGELGRAIGNARGIMHLGVAGEHYAEIVNSTKGALRRALARYASHWVSGYGINDISQGGSSAAVLALAAQLAAYAANNGRPFFQTTLPPYRSGGTPNGGSLLGEANRTPFNASIRAGLSWLAGMIEVADYVETARDSGLWITSPSNYSGDGIHETTAGNQAIIFTPERFRMGNVSGLLQRVI
jgi:hypothetical protein